MNRWLFALFAAATCSLSSVLIAADPLYLARPYDEITLDENNAGVKLKVQPLNLPGRALPAAADRKDDLEIELLDRPGERFRVGWNNIAAIKFFEELVLAEAQQLVKAEQFDEAYPYFQFLEAKYPKTAGLKEAVENFLWLQIGSDHKAGRNDAALALLLELHRRNPQRQGLGAALEQVTLKLVDERMAAENYRAARGLLRNLTQRYPDRAAAAASYEAQMRDKATASLAAARQALAAGKLREAHQGVRAALGIWPVLDGGQQLAEEIHQKYPVVTVGVTRPLTAATAASRDDWAARRTRSLVAPPVFERIATAAADEKPYRSSLAEIIADKNPRRVTFRLRANGAWPNAAHDISRGLLAAADRQRATFDPAWANLFTSVTVRNEDEVLIELSRPPVRIEAWLGAVLGLPGPYRIDSLAPPQMIFVRQNAAESGSPIPPSEIVERVYADTAAALRGLRRGEVSVVDRISPWDVKSLSESKEFAVGRYALPAVHVLVPNPARPLATNRTLKRAILYGIDRESILRRALLNGQTIAGCDTVSGPFPRPESKSDPRGYAYSDDVAVRPYDPGLAMALMAAELPAAADSAGAPKPPPLVLAHPADPVPRVACQSIARQLEAVGIPVSLRELAGQSPAADYDLLYAELPMDEPLVEVWRLFGPVGIAGSTSPAMLAALRELEHAADLLQASQKLHEIHALAAAELPVIPLWQLVDHFVYHVSVKGIGQRPVTLYQDVDHWQVEQRFPPE
ncbi:MAG TPA: ABC transporter substrate-binding protein [Pirellulaceae bacterium]|nr:ABC transporter substrate-binding protein [Pirellulaceae bacterium]